MFFLYLLACTAKIQPKSETTPANTTTQDKVSSVKPKKAMVALDGKSISVKWDDGDTFSGFDDKGNKIRARLMGYNTLESYGPVHQWGQWTEQELYSLSKEAGVFASTRVWKCVDTGKSGGYKRKLVDCPELRKGLLSYGLAHSFSISEPAPAEDLLLMSEAIKQKKGMWAKGAPKYLLTSLHSHAERPNKEAYNRLCDLSTGLCSKRKHTSVYATCEKVCVEDSCMIYVPYAFRYGEKRANCLK